MNQNDKIISVTHKWLETFVLGLNLCPFARHPYRNGKIRIVVFESDNLEHLTEMLVNEMHYLQETPPSVCETTLIILRDCLIDFHDYLDYLEVAEYVLEQMDLALVFQVASFHPDYQFEETLPNDAENYTNRSPYPMLHILREDSVERAIEAFPEVGDIPAQNIETMNTLGTVKLKQMLHELSKTPE